MKTSTMSERVYNLKKIDQKIRLDVRNAAEIAREAEQPASSELYTDVYATQAITDD